MFIELSKNIFFANMLFKRLYTYQANGHGFNKTHKANKGKADFFKKVLGFDRSNINKLAKQIKFNPKTV
jgi:hypothetical protein